MGLVKRRPFFLTAGEMTAEEADRVNIYFDELRDAVQTKLDTDNVFNITTPPTVNQEFRVVHNLGYIPFRFIQTSQNGPGQLYRSGQAWNKNVAFFKHEGSSIEVGVIIW